MAPSAHTQVLGAPIGGPPPPQPPKEKGRRRRWPIVVAVLTALVLIAGGLGYYFAIASKVDVPSVLTLSEQAAIDRLQEAGLEAETGEPVFTATVPEGQVAEQSPSAGSNVDKGDTITLHLSKGPELYDVPKLRGKTMDEARELLGENNLTLGEISRDFSGAVKEGRIISSSPTAGTALQPESKVDVVISDGPQPVDVPNVVGRTIEDARSVLTAVGLKVDVNEVFSDTAPEGEVLKQNPSSGTVDKGSTVNLEVSKGPQLFEVPNVEGMKYADATAALQAAGFPSNVSDLPGGPNRVLNQNPDPGSMERKGTEVTLYGF